MGQSLIAIPGRTEGRGPGRDNVHRRLSERDEHRALHLVLCRVLLALRSRVAKALATIFKLAAVEASHFVSDRIHRYVLQSANSS